MSSDDNGENNARNRSLVCVFEMSMISFMAAALASTVVCNRQSSARITAAEVATRTPERRGRCALNKCYALRGGYGYILWQTAKT